MTSHQLQVPLQKQASTVESFRYFTLTSHLHIQQYRKVIAGCLLLQVFAQLLIPLTLVLTLTPGLIKLVTTKLNPKFNNSSVLDN